MSKKETILRILNNWQDLCLTSVKDYNVLDEAINSILYLYNQLEERNIASQKVIVELNDKLQNESISKDKIKEKIKSYEGLKIMDKSAYEEQVKPLKELLEE